MLTQYGDASVGRSLVSDFVGSSTPASPFNSDAEVQHPILTYDVAVAIHQHRYHMVSTVESECPARIEVLCHHAEQRDMHLRRAPGIGTRARGEKCDSPTIRITEKEVLLTLR